MQIKCNNKNNLNFKNLFMYHKEFKFIYKHNFIVMYMSKINFLRFSLVSMVLIVHYELLKRLINSLYGYRAASNDRLS